MAAKRTALWGGLTALIVIGIALSLMFTFSDNPNQGQNDLLTAEQAQAEGLIQARTAGLVGEPTSASTKLMDLEEHILTSSKGAGQVGSGAVQVWVVTFRGSVEMTLPGAGGKAFDNITFALHARTGEVIGTDAYVDGDLNPFE